jgi:hypothetical protein
MKRLFSLVFGATVAMFLVSVLPLHSERPARREPPQVQKVQPEPLALPLPPPPQKPVLRAVAPEAKVLAAKAVAAAGNRPPSSPRFPSEETRLSSVYDYWSSQAPDPLITASESSRIRGMLTEHAVEPTSLEISCTPAICRSQMQFTDVASAGRLHALSRRSARRIYAAADPSDSEMRVSLYWTLTDEATAEAPDPVPQPSDLPGEAEPGDAYEHEAARPLDG